MDLAVTITKCIPNLTISGFIGDVHLVSHGKVFNEALTCPLPQVTRRPLALQHEQYCKVKIKHIRMGSSLKAFLYTFDNKMFDSIALRNINYKIPR